MTPVSKILAKPRLQYIDGRTWLVTRTFVYQSELAGRIVIRRGFVTDFNSTPRLIWWLIPSVEYGEAGLVHDKLYRDGHTTRRVADRVHLEVMRVLNAPKWKRGVMYVALRIFGWWAWKGHRNRVAPVLPAAVTSAALVADAVAHPTAPALDLGPICKPSEPQKAAAVEVQAVVKGSRLDGRGFFPS